MEREGGEEIAERNIHEAEGEVLPRVSGHERNALAAAPEDVCDPREIHLLRRKGDADREEVAPRAVSP